MGKRQVRIFNRELIARQAEILQQEVQVVLQNGAVVQGKATAFTADKITVTDKRFHKHALAITEVAEVVFDKESLY
jgi:hypothetical protein